MSSAGHERVLDDFHARKSKLVVSIIGSRRKYASVSIYFVWRDSIIGWQEMIF
jgi:hypothetical protein